MRVVHRPSKKSWVGRRYGRLTVVAYDHSAYANLYNISIIHKWLCQCDCGGNRIVSSNNLMSGNTRSCGCLKKESNARKIRYNGKLKKEV